MNKEQKEHYGKVARLGCILCKQFGYETDDCGCEIHHIRRGGIRSQSPVIPLCPEHHRGNTGIHGMGRKAFERNYETTEESLLQIVNEILQSRGKR
jgi:hypothetical protein